jgi:hypothetical protein
MRCESQWRARVLRLRRKQNGGRGKKGTQFFSILTDITGLLWKYDKTQFLQLHCYPGGDVKTPLLAP